MNETETKPKSELSLIEELTVSSMDVPSDVREIIRSKMEFFESALLHVIMKHPNFWYKIAKNSLRSPIQEGRKERFKDFSRPIDNVIYDQIDKWCLAMSKMDCWGTNPIPIMDNIILMMIQDDVKRGDGLEDDVELAKERLSEINAIKQPDILQFVCSGYNFWLDIKRNKFVSNMAYKKNLSSEETDNLKKSALRDVNSTVKSNSLDFESFLIKSTNPIYISEQKENTMDITTLTIMNNFLGGLQKEKTGLIIAPSSGGKTCMCCQIAAGLIDSGHHVLYISTEESASELYPRFISCYTGISYKLIKGGIPIDIMPPEARASIMSLKRINSYLKVEYFEKGAVSIEDGVDAILEKYRSEGIPVDCVIVDWFGAGVNLAKYGRMDKRDAYADAMRQLDSLNKKYGVHMIVAHQAAIMDSSRNIFVDETCCGDFKRLHEFCDWAVGISNQKGDVMEHHVPSNMSFNPIVPQFLNLFKNRGGERYVHIIVYPNFEMQRFEECGYENKATGNFEMGRYVPSIPKLRDLVRDRGSESNVTQQ